MHQLVARQLSCTKSASTQVLISAASVVLCCVQKMTYARQLEMYESAVMQKRLEEMTEAELQQLMAEVESDKARLAVQKERLQRQKQQSSTQ